MNYNYLRSNMKKKKKKKKKKKLKIKKKQKMKKWNCWMSLKKVIQVILLLNSDFQEGRQKEGF